MAITKVTYASDAAIAITLTGPLTTGLFRASAVVDNSSNLYMDALVGGMIGSAGTSWTIDDTIDLYVIAQYSATGTDVGGGIGALLGNGDGAEVEDTDFVLANLPRIMSVIPDQTSPTVNQDYHWGPVGIAQFFGGVLPLKWSILMHNNTAGSIDSGNLNYIGITYTTV